MLNGPVERYRRHRFAFLFVVLLATITGHAVLGTAEAGVPALEVFLAASLIAAIASAAQERSIRVLVALGLAFAVSRAVAAALDLPTLLSLSELFWILATLLAAIVTASHALRARVVDAERIFAALDAYLLVGLMFGMCYWRLDQHWPESFSPASAGHLSLGRAIYFSFVTITTVGYGDIVAAGGAARGLAILEAVSGQMYLAVLVSWLVSLFARERDT